MNIILLGHELTSQDMIDLGWDETAQSIGLQSDVSFVVALDDVDNEYNIIRHLRRSSYEKLDNINFRGKRRACVITVWN